MNDQHFPNLAECTQFRQALAARPPRLVHGAALLMTALLATALAWAALTQARLVVLAQGRVRSAEIPRRVFAPSGFDAEARVVESPFDEGDPVRQGDVLVRLDTTQLDNRIAKLTLTIEAGRRELEKLSAQARLLVSQQSAARQKAESELKHAVDSLELARARRESEIRRGQAELAAAEFRWQCCRKLSDTRVATQHELVDAEAKLAQARETLAQAELPLDGSAVDVARDALNLISHDFAVRTAELEAHLAAKQGEVDAAGKDLANLNCQRQAAVLRSPIDGVVVAGRIRVGDVLEPGKPALEVAREECRTFEAVVSGEDVGLVRLGMPVRIRFDAYDYQKYGVLQGHVSYIAPDSQATPPAAGGQGEGRPVPRLAFLVRVELHAGQVGRGEVEGPVKLGLGGTAEIITDSESLLAIFLKRLRQTISLI